MTTRRPPRQRTLSNVATVALALVTATAALGLGRLVVDTSLVVPSLAALGVAHLVSWGGRRLGLPVVMGAGLTLLAGAELIVATRYAGLSTAGLPNGAVLSAVSSDLRQGWQVFQVEGAPAPVVDGFVVATMAAVTVIAAAADALAFRVGAAIEAIAPAAGLVAFTTVLGGPDHRLTATAAFLLAGLAFLLAERVARQAADRHWLGGPGNAGPPALLRAGATLALLGVAGGLVLTPVLPGAASDPVIDLDDDGDSASATVNPLVQIQARLVDQADVEVFTVRSDERAYWRLTALDRFDGATWSGGGDYVGADGELDGRSPVDATNRTLITQHVDLVAWGDVWLPAAYQPTSIDAATTDVRWNPVSSSLVIDPDRSADDPVSYDVVSSSRIIDRELAASSTSVGASFDELRRLPDDFSPAARRTARQVTAGAVTPYAQAVALQAFFRDEFDYSLDVAAGHGIDDIDDFLRRRVGYCEQFAGTYAALARSLGLPSRVAVGFTPGEVDPDDPEVFHVRGEHAHAWPEVYLGGLGWLAFEPTPGRGVPGAEPYTGVVEQQEGEQAPGIPTPTTTTTTPSGLVDDQVVPTRPAQAITDDVASTSSPNDGTPWPVRALLGLVGAALLWIVLVPTVRAVRRGQARRRATGRPAAQVDLAWREAAAALTRAGIRRDPAETPHAFMTRVSGHEATLLADAVTTLWFGGPHRIDTTMAEHARAASARVAENARRGSGRRDWFVRGLDPRTH